MQLLQPFNPMNYDPSQSGGQLPIGRHPVIIDGDEITATKNNDGGMLVLNLSVIDGPNKGASGVYRLNLYNQSQVACEIAHKQLAAICHVTGMAGVIINDAAQLHNIPFYVEVAPQVKNPEYNEVKKVYDMNGIEAGKAGCGQAIQGQAAPAAAFQQPAAPVQQPVQNAFQQPPTPAGGFGQPAAAPVQQQPAQQQQWPTPAEQPPVQQQPAATPSNAPAWPTPAPQQQPVQNTAPSGQAPWLQNK